MKTFLALSVGANIFLVLVLNGVISDWHRYSAGVEADFKIVEAMEHQNSETIRRFRTMIEEAKVKSFVLCMRREKNVDRCGKKGKV